MLSLLPNFLVVSEASKFFPCNRNSCLIKICEDRKFMKTGQGDYAIGNFNPPKYIWPHETSKWISWQSYIVLTVYHFQKYQSISVRPSAVADLEGFLGFWPKSPLRFQETSWRFNELKLNFLKVVPCPFFVVEVLVFQVIEVNCVRLGVLLLPAKLN